MHNLQYQCNDASKILKIVGCLRLAYIIINFPCERHFLFNLYHMGIVALNPDSTDCQLNFNP
jgi:hypothetical protein